MAYKLITGIQFRMAMGSLILLLLLSACSSTSTSMPEAQSQLTPSALLPTATNLPTEIPTPTVTQDLAAITLTTETPLDPATGWKSYTDSSTGLSFQFPPAWYGPDVYAFDQGVRLEVGSDKVYPYGTDPLDRVYEKQNSYYVVIQYTKNSNHWTLDEYRQNQPWSETYLSLLNLKDGESRSGLRDLVTRVRKVQVGGFEGLEFISTLSETAQTDMSYARQVVLFDKDLNALTIMGTPNNVEVPDKSAWREVYSQIDQANLDNFHKIVESIAVR
jgi:hypothetical protein